ncbi:hypothetical protein [Massilia sp. DD77]|uniref:hypothetical protein n=1 Tax=Massilia sp. DD77 TaxID=3109349 RepID=UPI002FFD8F26
MIATRADRPSEPAMRHAASENLLILEGRAIQARLGTISAVEFLKRHGLDGELIHLVLLDGAA